MFDTVDIIMLIFSQERKTTAKAVLWCFSGNMIPNAITPKEVALDVFKTDILPSSGEFLPSEIREDSSAIRARYFNVLPMAGWARARPRINSVPHAFITRAARFVQSQ
jgi:hypothetical protein